MAKARGQQKTPRKRRKYLRSTSPDPMYQQLHLTPYGRFAGMSMNVLGLNAETVEYYNRYNYTTVADFLTKVPSDFDQVFRTGIVKNDILDTVDAFFVDYFEEEKEKYEAHPVPIYELIQVKDLRAYMNQTIWTLAVDGSLAAQIMPALEKNGIISVYELLKLNLKDFHWYTKLSEDQAREFLSQLKRVDVHYLDQLTTFCAPVDAEEEVPVTLPVTAESKQKVAYIMDDALAGEDVSLDGLTPYERTLYSKAKDAVDICGSDFYFDVVDEPYKFWHFARCLVRVTGPGLELMDNYYFSAALYNEVPQWARKLSFWTLKQFSHPQNSYEYGSTRDFLRGFDSHMTLEESYNAVQALLHAARTPKEYTDAYDSCNAGNLDALMMWTVTATVERAVDECMYRETDGTINRDRWKKRAVIYYRANGYSVKRTAELTRQSQYSVVNEEKFAPYSVLAGFRAAQHDLFALMFLMNGGMPIYRPQIEAIMSKEAAYILWKAVSTNTLNCRLYWYSARYNAMILASKDFLGF